MSEKITDKMMERLEQLSMLGLTGEEQECIKRDLGQLLAHVHKLDELDLKEVEPMFHMCSGKNVFREDVAREEGEGVFDNDRQGDWYLVPKANGL
jgi:aspartyl/glutamyl-tRNA(Asn/Gln) amidotransferase C subunit